MIYAAIWNKATSAQEPASVIPVSSLIRRFRFRVCSVLQANIKQLHAYDWEHFSCQRTAYASFTTYNHIDSDGVCAQVASFLYYRFRHDSRQEAHRCAAARYGASGMKVDIRQRFFLPIRKKQIKEKSFGSKTAIGSEKDRFISAAEITPWCHQDQLAVRDASGKRLAEPTAIYLSAISNTRYDSSLLVTDEERQKEVQADEVTGL